MAMEFDADMILGLGYFVSSLDPVEPTFTVASFSPDETKEARLLLGPTDLAATATFSLGNGFFDLVGMDDALTWAGNAVWDTGNFTPGALAFLNSVDNSNWSGTSLSVPNGGTGASTLTGYVKGSGTSALTASATIPNTDITGLGTVSTQNTGTSGATVPLLNGNNTSSGSNTQSGAQFLTGVISPTALAAATDNWAPTGFATCNVIRMDATGPVNLNGLAGGATGRCVRLTNISASVVTIVAGAGTSTAANRFATGLAIAAGSFVDLWYDGTTSRWRLSR